MSSHQIFIMCSVDGCGAIETIYTGDSYTDLFYDSGPDSWEGEFIRIKCKEHVDD